MQNIGKYIFLLIFCNSLSFAGLFESSNIWKNGTIESKEYNTLSATLYVGGDNKIRVGISMHSDDCRRFEDDVYETGTMKFNGTLVKMFAQCVGNNERMDFPQTYNGNNFLVNEFDTKRNVVAAQDDITFTFSTNGFREEYKRVRDSAVAEANAI